MFVRLVIFVYLISLVILFSPYLILMKRCDINPTDCQKGHGTNVERVLFLSYLHFLARQKTHTVMVMYSRPYKGIVKKGPDFGIGIFCGQDFG